MKLAEALNLRADLNIRLNELCNRLNNNARVQEGDTPAEDPQTLLVEIESVADQLTELIQRINKTNLATMLESGETLTDALAVRDTLRMKSGIYRALAQHASATQDRYTRYEVKFVPTIDVSETMQHADSLAQAHRELDAQIQALNWGTELID